MQSKPDYKCIYPKAIVVSLIVTFFNALISMLSYIEIFDVIFDSRMLTLPPAEKRVFLQFIYDI